MTTFGADGSLILGFLTATRRIQSAMDMDESIEEVPNSQDSSLDEDKLNKLDSGSMPDSTK